MDVKPRAHTQSEPGIDTTLTYLRVGFSCQILDRTVTVGFRSGFSLNPWTVTTEKFKYRSYITPQGRPRWLTNVDER